VAQLYPRALGSLFSPLTTRRDCGGGILTRLHTGFLQLQLIYDRQSVGQSVLVSGAHLGTVTNFSFSLKFLLDSCLFVIVSALSDERTGL
jgi:hypothetical protein